MKPRSAGEFRRYAFLGSYSYVEGNSKTIGQLALAGD